MWLVYIMFRPDGSPLYVGIGKARSIRRQRWQDHLAGSRNRILAGSLKKYGVGPVVVAREDLSRAEANATEIALISAIGRADTGAGPLANMTDGGDGCLGYNLTSEQLAKRNASIRSARAQPEIAEHYRAAIQAAWDGKSPEERAAHGAKIGATQKGRKVSEEARQRMVAAKLGKPNLKARGQTRSPEQRAHISEGTRAAMAALPAETKSAMAAVTPEKREAMSAAALARLATPEARAASVVRLNAPGARQKQAASITTTWANNPKIWITDGTHNARVPPTADIPEGWRPGRAFGHRTRRIAA